MSVSSIGRWAIALAVPCLLLASRGSGTAPHLPQPPEAVIELWDENASQLSPDEISTIFQSPTRENISNLVLLLRHPSADVRIEAARVLGTLGREGLPAVPDLAGRLEVTRLMEEDEDVRRTVIGALLQIFEKANSSPDMRVLRTVRTALRDEDASVRNIAMKAMASLDGRLEGEPIVVDRLVEEIDSQTRESGFRALGTWGSFDSLERFESVATTKERIAALQGMNKLSSLNAKSVTMVDRWMNADSDAELRRLSLDLLDQKGRRLPLAGTILVSAFRSNLPKTRIKIQRALEQRKLTRQDAARFLAYQLAYDPTNLELQEQWNHVRKLTGLELELGLAEFEDPKATDATLVQAALMLGEVPVEILTLHRSRIDSLRLPEQPTVTNKAAVAIVQKLAGIPSAGLEYWLRDVLPTPIERPEFHATVVRALKDAQLSETFDFLLDCWEATHSRLAKLTDIGTRNDANHERWLRLKSALIVSLGAQNRPLAMIDELLHEAVESPDPRLKKAALQVMVERDPRSSATLTSVRSALLSQDLEIRLDCLDVLKSSTSQISAEIIPELTGMLASDDYSEPVATLGVLTKLGKQAAPAFPAVKEFLLSVTSAEERLAAAHFLCLFERDVMDLLPELRLIVNDDDSTARAEIIGLLGRFADKDKPTQQVLEACLTDAAPEVRTAAIRSLREMNAISPWARTRLLAIVNSDLYRECRFEALKTLDLMTHHLKQRQELIHIALRSRIFWEQVPSLVEPFGDGGLVSLSHASASADPRVRSRARDVLKWFSDTAAGRMYLEKTLVNDDPIARGVAAILLNQLPTGGDRTKLIRGLVEWLGHPDFGPTAYMHLTELKTQAVFALEDYVQQLEEPAEGRIRALRLLAQAGASAASAAEAVRLVMQSDDGEIGFEAAMSLATIDPAAEDAHQVLFSAWKDGIPLPMEPLLIAIEALGPAASDMTPLVIAQWKTQPRAELLKTLLALDPTAATFTPLLMGALLGGDPTLKEGALAAVAGLAEEGRAEIAAAVRKEFSKQQEPLRRLYFFQLLCQVTGNANDQIELANMALADDGLRIVLPGLLHLLPNHGVDLLARTASSKNRSISDIARFELLRLTKSSAGRDSLNAILSGGDPEIQPLIGVLLNRRPEGSWDEDWAQSVVAFVDHSTIGELAITHLTGLRETGARSLGDALVSRSQNPEVAEKILSAIGSMGTGGQAAAGALRGFLFSAQGRLKTLAALALVEVDPTAQDAALQLANAISQPDATIASADLWRALQRMGRHGRAATNAVIQRLDYLGMNSDVLNTLAAIDPDAEISTEIFSAGLMDPNSWIRTETLQAFRSLEGAGRQSVERMLQKSLGTDTPPNRRLAALSALTSVVSDVNQLEKLTELALQDRILRSQAGPLLKRLPAHGLVTLERATRHADFQTREFAWDMLIQLAGSPDARKTLASALKAEAKPARMLTGVLFEESPDDVSPAEWVSYLAKLTGVRQVRSQVSNLLQESGNEGALALARLASDSNQTQSIRLDAIQELARLGDEAWNARPVLMNLVQKGSALLADEAAVALAIIDPWSTVAANRLVEIADRSSEEPTEALCRAMVSVGPLAFQAAPTLVELIQNQGVSLRAIDCLVAIDPTCQLSSNWLAWSLRAGNSAQREHILAEFEKLHPTGLAAISTVLETYFTDEVQAAVRLDIMTQLQMIHHQPDELSYLAEVAFADASPEVWSAVPGLLKGIPDRGFRVLSKVIHANPPTNIESEDEADGYAEMYLAAPPAVRDITTQRRDEALWLALSLVDNFKGQRALYEGISSKVAAERVLASIVLDHEVASSDVAVVAEVLNGYLYDPVWTGFAANRLELVPELGVAMLTRFAENPRNPLHGRFEVVQAIAHMGESAESAVEPLKAMIETADPSLAWELICAVTAIDPANPEHLEKLSWFVRRHSTLSAVPLLPVFFAAGRVPQSPLSRELDQLLADRFEQSKILPAIDLLGYWSYRFTGALDVLRAHLSHPHPLVRSAAFRGLLRSGDKSPETLDALRSVEIPIDPEFVQQRSEYITQIETYQESLRSSVEDSKPIGNSGQTAIDIRPRSSITLDKSRPSVPGRGLLKSPGPMTSTLKP